MFCFSYGCTGIDDATWRQHLMERERLLDRAPTFLEVYEQDRKEKKSEHLWEDVCSWDPYKC